jgi:hypothetical protein
MIPESIPSEATYVTMILMRIVQSVSKDDIGINTPF